MYTNKFIWEALEKKKMAVMFEDSQIFEYLAIIYIQDFKNISLLNKSVHNKYIPQA